MIKLYHSPQTRSVRIYWLLEELHLPYELEVVPFSRETLKSPDHLARHPLGKVPVLEDDGLTMFESGAILEYLLEKYGDGRLAPAVGTPERGRFLQWVHFSEATVLPPLGDMAQHLIFKPESERIPAVVTDARARIIEILGVLDRELHGKSYLMDRDFSGADIMLGFGLWLVKLFGLLTDEYPNLVAYMTRLEERPAFRKATGS